MLMRVRFAIARRVHQLRTERAARASIGAGDKASARVDAQNAARDRTR
jgi:hypothetical protein